MSLLSIRIDDNGGAILLNKTIRNEEYLHKLKLYCFPQSKKVSRAVILAILKCTTQISTNSKLLLIRQRAVEISMIRVDVVYNSELLLNQQHGKSMSK